MNFENLISWTLVFLSVLFQALVMSFVFGLDFLTALTCAVVTSLLTLISVVF